MYFRIFNNFKSILLIYLSLICILSFVFLHNSYLLETNNSMAEWVINYQGGFGRRGLAGELFLKIADITNLNLKTVILYFLFLIISIYHYLLFTFIKNIKFNLYFISIILSPLFVIFPIAELEALGRKDILIPISFLIFVFIYQNFSFKILFFSLFLIYSILLLTHEVSIFYLPFFYFILFFKLKNVNFKNFIFILIITLYFLLIIYLLINFTHTKLSIEKMCNILNLNYNTNCGLGAFVLDRTLKDNISELGSLTFFDILRAIWIFIIGSIGLLILFFYTSKAHIFQSKVLKKIKLKHIFMLVFLPTLVPFFIAVDWGRWFNLSYTMTILFYFFCYKSHIIKIDEFKNPIFLSYIEKKNLWVCIFLFVFCLSWNPKAIYKDDTGSIPLYRAITKSIKYIF